jgi:hypothetical protein
MAYVCHGHGPRQILSVLAVHAATWTVPVTQAGEQSAEEERWHNDYLDHHQCIVERSCLLAYNNYDRDQAIGTGAG